MKPHECAATRQCRKCGEEKPLDAFYASQPTTRVCKECQREQMRRRYASNPDAKLAKCAEYRAENKDRVKRSMADWYQRNRQRVLPRMHAYNARPERRASERERQAARYAAQREEILAKRKAYYEANPQAVEAFREYNRKHYRENKPMYSAKVGKRRAARIGATPAWADPKAIADVYREAKARTEATGVRHVVDHIVPLQGRTVCGLHVENNLQVIPEKENLRKFNKLVEDIVRSRS